MSKVKNWLQIDKSHVFLNGGGIVEVATLSLNGWDIFKLALTTGVITAIINQSLSWLRDLHKDKTANSRMANYSALRLAIELESFSIACADAISDADMFNSSGGHAGVQHTKVPVLQTFPEDIDWKALDPSLTAKVLTFRNELTLAHQAIVFWYEIDSECVPNACLNQLGLCGYRAWLISGELRARHNIPLFDPKLSSWDVAACLKKQHDLACEEKRKHDGT